MSQKDLHDYAGQQIDVHWDSRLCIHVAECVQAKGELFVAGRQPWCIPDAASAQEVAMVCERCPSGALTYADKAGHAEQGSADNSVNVINNGPLYARGHLEIEGAPKDMKGIGFRAALCRCGQSKNKPFCDNSHLEARFQDPGAIGETGPGLKSPAGALKIKALPNGPLLLSGQVTLVAGSGRAAWQGERAALCRCGESKNKPFCDGSHEAVAFRTE